MTSSWLEFACGTKQAVLVAPPHLALEWPGNVPTGRFEIHLTYWQPVMKDLEAAMPDVKWEGHPDSPHTLVESDADAKALVARLGAFLKAQDPSIKPKKQKEVTIFTAGKGFKIVSTYPRYANHNALSAREDDKVELWTWKVASGSVLLWKAIHKSRLRVRVDQTSMVLVDSNAADEALDGLLEGRATARGTWAFDSGVAILGYSGITIRECKGLESANVADLEALAAKKPSIVKPNNRDALAGAVVLKVTPGTYTATTGGDDTTRWLRFTLV